jgi:hypothetical protein
MQSEQSGFGHGLSGLHMKKSKPLREIAVLTGFDANGAVVFEAKLDLHEYWDEPHPVIDEDGFRLRHGIRRLTGELYGSSGNLIQEFENLYGPRGEYVSGRARHEDGTVTE